VFKRLLQKKDAQEVLFSRIKALRAAANDNGAQKHRKAA
jgi:hypothetical protein